MTSAILKELEQVAIPTRRFGFLNLFNQMMLRDLLRNKIRVGLSVMGIALGVAILLAITLANSTAVSSFSHTLDRIAGRTNLTISANTAPDFNENIFRQLTWIWSEGCKMTPVIEQIAVIPPHPGDQGTETVQVLGVDLMADQAFRSYDWVLQGKPHDFLSVFNRNQVFVGDAFAQRHHLTAGSPFPLLVNDEQKTFQVAGILSGQGIGGAYGGDLLVMDIGAAQDAFGLYDQRNPDNLSGGRLSRIDLIVPEGKLDDVIARLEKQLPHGLEASRPDRRNKTVEKMLRAYQFNLTVLSFIALLVGMFLIYNTMAITIIRRRPEIGTLRALGMPRLLIFRLFITEAVLLGVVGSLLGLVLGVLLAQGAVQAISSTIENLYATQPVNGLDIHLPDLLRAFGFGVGMTLLGALGPVIEAARIAPAEATRRASYEIRVQRVSSRLAWVALGLLLISLWSAFQPPMMGLPLFGFLSALALILGAAFLVPFVLDGLLIKLLPWLRQYWGEEGRLAALSLHGALGRTTIAVSSLMIGIAMMVSLAVMIGSFRETVIAWVNQSVKADLWIEPSGRAGKQIVLKLSPQVVETLRYFPGVVASDAFFEFPIHFKNKRGDDEPARVAVGQLDVLAKYAGLKFINGQSTTEVIDRVNAHMSASPGVLVTESFASRNHLRQGDTMILDTPSGPVEFSVDGIYYDYASDLGYIVMPRPLYNLYFNDDSVSGLALYLDKGQNPQAVRDALFKKLADQPGHAYQVRIKTTQELRNEILKIFDKTFSITYALHIISIIVALLAVTNSLFALVMEARRDFGILKYMGASTQQIRKMVLVQGGILGLLGNLAGLVIGLLLSLLLIYVINKQSFGWTIQLSIPWLFLIQSFVLVMITAVLSGLLPAKMAAKTQAPDVIRDQ